MSIDRYEKQRKSDRNRSLYNYWHAHQDLPLTVIGLKFKLCKQRVSQIISREAKILEKENETNKVAA